MSIVDVPIEIRTDSPKIQVISINALANLLFKQLSCFHTSYDTFSGHFLTDRTYLSLTTHNC